MRSRDEKLYVITIDHMIQYTCKIKKSCDSKFLGDGKMFRFDLKIACALLTMGVTTRGRPTVFVCLLVFVFCLIP